MKIMGDREGRTCYLERIVGDFRRRERLLLTVITELRTIERFSILDSGESWGVGEG
jgi:hypothetical protein